MNDFVLSILFAKIYGIAGVIAATVIALVANSILTFPEGRSVLRKMLGPE